MTQSDDRNTTSVAANGGEGGWLCRRTRRGVMQGGTNESRRKTWIPRLEAVVVLVAVLVGGGCGGSDD